MQGQPPGEAFSICLDPHLPKRYTDQGVVAACPMASDRRWGPRRRAADRAVRECRGITGRPSVRAEGARGSTGRPVAPATALLVASTRRWRAAHQPADPQRPAAAGPGEGAHSLPLGAGNRLRNRKILGKRPLPGIWAVHAILGPSEDGLFRDPGWSLRRRAGEACRPGSQMGGQLAAHRGLLDSSRRPARSSPGPCPSRVPAQPDPSRWGSAFHETAPGPGGRAA